MADIVSFGGSDPTTDVWAYRKEGNQYLLTCSPVIRRRAGQEKDDLGVSVPEHFTYSSLLSLLSGTLERLTIYRPIVSLKLDDEFKRPDTNEGVAGHLLERLIDMHNACQRMHHALLAQFAGSD